MEPIVPRRIQGTALGGEVAGPARPRRTASAVNSFAIFLQALRRPLRGINRARPRLLRGLWQVVRSNRRPMLPGAYPG
jgi:hypothetical protein